MSTIMISIHPKHVYNIMTGSKRYEYRKSVPLNLRFMLIYASAPVQRVVAVCEVDHIICDRPERVWQRTHADGCVSKCHFRAYYAKSDLAYAIRIKSVYQFAPVELSRFGIARPPQSWQYLSGALHEILDGINLAKTDSL